MTQGTKWFVGPIAAILLVTLSGGCASRFGSGDSESSTERRAAEAERAAALQAKTDRNRPVLTLVSAGEDPKHELRLVVPEGHEEYVSSTTDLIQRTGIDERPLVAAPSVIQERTLRLRVKEVAESGDISIE
ncbi:MAG: hypothetical protein AAF517_22405, partial [Planctomycetota bacterium]